LNPRPPPMQGKLLPKKPGTWPSLDRLRAATGSARTLERLLVNLSPARPAPKAPHFFQIRGRAERDDSRQRA
jgi:hypothetical protein